MREILGTFDAGLPAGDALDGPIRRALEEDAAHDDRSTLPIAAAKAPAVGRVLAREDGVLAGAPMFQRAFELVDPSASLAFDGLSDGDAFTASEVVLTVRGPGDVLLSAERTALNFLQRLSGIATRTRRCVDETDGRIAVCDTRKTTPGLRAFEKYAVVTGGGTSHRWSLGDMVLLKENHLSLAGGVTAAVRAVRADPESAKLPLTVEVQTLEQALEAAELRVDRLLLDNMTTGELARVARELGAAGHRPELEASGGFTHEDLATVSRTGVDLVSLGSLTHSVRSIDFSFLVEPAEAP